MARFAFLGSLILALAACGDGSNDSPLSVATLTGTLAYVVSECRENGAGFSLRSALLVRQGERDPVTVMEVPDIVPTQPLGVQGLCRYVGSLRHGGAFTQLGPFQFLAVSPDGSAVVFELSDEFSLLGDNLLTPEQRGFFFVRADGTGLRRLGPPSRHQSFIPGGTTNNRFDLVFSPDGQAVIFPDLVPNPDSEEASQLFAMDLVTGKRTQLTQLPPAGRGSDTGLCCPYFLDDETIVFDTRTNPDGLNPEGKVIALLINADGSGLRLPPTVVDVSGSVVDPRFVITGEPSSVLLRVPGQPVNATSPNSPVREIFFFDGDKNILQLTNFRRLDTRSFGGEARERVYFIASADPLRTNPSNNCQIFSMSSLGGDLRQLTRFYETERSRTNCASGSRLGSGCLVSPFGRDVNNGTLLFHSNCNPFGTNPNGHELFALDADGTNLRQLTDLRGFVVEADGTVRAEFPYPFAYPGPQSE